MGDKRTMVAVLLLVGGILLAYYCHSQLESYDRGPGSGLWWAKQFSTEHQSRSSRLETGRIAGGVAALAGIVILATSRSKK